MIIAAIQFIRSQNAVIDFSFTLRIEIPWSLANNFYARAVSL